MKSRSAEIFNFHARSMAELIVPQTSVWSNKEKIQTPDYFLFLKNLSVNYQDEKKMTLVIFFNFMQTYDQFLCE